MRTLAVGGGILALVVLAALTARGASQLRRDADREAELDGWADTRPL